MKKLILMMLFVMVNSVVALAGSDIKVVKGDAKFLKTASGSAVLVFDWDGATYDNKQPLAEKFTNLEELKKVAWNSFTETFNDKSKTVTIVPNEQEKSAKYKFTMQVTNMDQYFQIVGFVKGNSTKVWGTMTVTDLSTNKIIAVISVTELDGGARPSQTGTFSKCFEELAKQVSKCK